MRCFKLLFMGAAVLALSVPAMALTLPPLPPTGNMRINAGGSFAEIFGADGSNSAAIGYTPTDVLGDGNGEFVLFTGYTHNVGAAPTTNPTIIQDGDGNDIIGADAIKAALQGGELYVGGLIENIKSGGVSQSYDLTAAGTDWQLSYSLYNAPISTMAFGETAAGAGELYTTYTINSPSAHLDIWADGTPDATLGATSGAGQRYQGASGEQKELPLRDSQGNLMGAGNLLSDGIYYDSDPTATTWGELAFSGDPNDDDYVFWSFVGNPDATLEVNETWYLGDSFQADLDGDGTKETIYMAGQSNITFVQSQVGQWIPGASAVTDADVNNRDVVNDDGEGFGNRLLVDGYPYKLTAQLEWGPSIADAYDSCPNTYTFQQGEPGGPGGIVVGSETLLSGPLVPEPVTMAGLMLGVGSLLGYVRRRRK